MQSRCTRVRAVRARPATNGEATDGPGGIYVHFPFCLSRCGYCDFASSVVPDIPHRADADAVVADLRARARLLPAPARSLYFGGGTPSLWHPAQIARVVAAARDATGLEAGSEITLEANPAEVTPGWAATVLAAGVNRLSIGAQSIRGQQLRAVGRRHTLPDILHALGVASTEGFRSYSADLISGLPGQRAREWRADLEAFAGLGVPHLSVYDLSLEEGTPLAREVRAGRVALPDADAQTEMLFATRAVLRQAGYEHYEVSSYALPRQRAVHNCGYWEMRPYLGLGAGAHGFSAPVRWANDADPARYMAALAAGEPPPGTEERLDPATLAFERLMTGLRLLEDGVDLGERFASFAEPAAELARRGRLIVRGTRLWLTDEGLRFMNEVLIALMPRQAARANKS